MSGQDLILTDYTEVPKEEVAFCNALQKKIDAGEHMVLTYSFASDDEKNGESIAQEDEEKFPKVFRRFQNKLYTQKYAGILTYEGRTVQICSRFDQMDGKNRFLQYLFYKSKDIPIKQISDMQVPAGIGTFDPIIAYIFLGQLKTAFAVGVYREYHNFSYNDSRVRGRIDIARHLRCNMLQNGCVAYTTREYTADNPLNQLILEAYAVLQKNPRTREFVKAILQKEPSLRRPLDALQWELDSHSGDRNHRQKLLQQTIRPISHPMHYRYEAVRRTAVLILKQEGVHLFEEAGERVGGILIPMDRMWEIFLEKCMFPEPDMKAQARMPIMLERKGIYHGLFKPDLVFGYHRDRKNGRALAKLVLDAKYRPAWGETALKKAKPNDTEEEKTQYWGVNVRHDIHQILAYMYLLGAENGGVIFPVQAEAAQRKEYMGRYQLCRGMEESFYKIPFVVPEKGSALDQAAYYTLLDAQCELCKSEVEKIYNPVKQKKSDKKS